MPLMCDRCGKPIAAGDGERVVIHGASGAGGAVTVHKAFCARSRPTPSRRA